MPTRDSSSGSESVVASNVVDVVVDPVKYENCTGRLLEPVPEEESSQDAPDQQQSSIGESGATNEMSRERQGRVNVPDFTAIRIPTGSIGALYPESKFKGHQRSGKSQYEVEITIKHVDLRENTMSGFLHIRNLSEQDITTFFTGELISSSLEFFANPYGAEPKIDLQHWAKFPHLRSLMHLWTRDYPNIPEYAYNLASEDFIYSRWKERHLVPDHKQSILGACYAGFYYVSYQKSTGSITGWYYHKNSELNQKLTLKHCPRIQGKLPTYEFR